MKKLALVLIAMLAFSTLVMAEATAVGNDILGPHNVNGHGCASCHTPHGGGVGNGGTNAQIGETYLWGRDFVAATYQTFGNDGTANSPDQFAITNAGFAETDPLFHTAACLSCHDGSATIVGMAGTTFETVNGKNITSYLANDGYSLKNDHPVHVAYVPGTAAHNWPGTIDVNGKISWTATTPAFDYGHPIRFYGTTAGGGQAMVECTTCHNPHIMNKYDTKGAAGIVTSKFFIRGAYNADNPTSNSATQFCRSCHYSKSNEAMGVSQATVY